MTTMSLADVKARLSELVGRVHAHHERVTVTVHGRPSAVLIAVEDLEALEETLSVLSDADTLRRLWSPTPSWRGARSWVLRSWRSRWRHGVDIRRESRVDGSLLAARDSHRSPSAG